MVALLGPEAELQVDFQNAEYGELGVFVFVFVFVFLFHFLHFCSCLLSRICGSEFAMKGREEECWLVES